MYQDARFLLLAMANRRNLQSLLLSYWVILTASGLWLGTCFLFYTAIQQRKELAFSRLDSQAGLEDVNLAFRNFTSQLHVARTVQRQTSEEEAACQLRLQAARAEEQACHQNPARARVQAALDGYFNSDRLVFHHFMENYWQPSKVSRTISDRGLLMVAGPAKLTANAFVNLHVIHHHLNSTIPTTLYYWGAHEPDRINAATQAFIMEHIPQLNIVDASTLPYPRHMHRLFAPDLPLDEHSRWKVKVAAIYSAPYREVIVLDPGSLPLVDPTFMFDIPTYQQAGNLFWPDRLCIHQQSADSPYRLYAGLGMPARVGNTYTTSSGQFLLHRQKFADVLEWLLFLNSHNEYTYYYAAGDKDTYRAAFFLAGKLDKFAQVEIRTSAALFRRQRNWVGCGSVYHHPESAGVLFLHTFGRAQYDITKRERHLVTHLLLGPSCSWNSNYWYLHETPEMNKIEKLGPTITQSACGYDLDDLTTIKDNCQIDQTGQNGTLPPILAVPSSSLLGRTNNAAGQAFQLALQATSNDPEVFKVTGDGRDFNMHL